MNMRYYYLYTNIDRIMRLEPDALKIFRESQREEFLKSVNQVSEEIKLFLDNSINK